MSTAEIQLLADHVTLKTWRSYERVSDRADHGTWREIYPFAVGYAVHVWCWLFDQTNNPLNDHFDDFVERVSLGSQGAYEELFGPWDSEGAEASFHEEVVSAYMDVDYLWQVYRQNYDRLGAGRWTWRLMTAICLKLDIPRLMHFVLLQVSSPKP